MWKDRVLYCFPVSKGQTTLPTRECEPHFWTQPKCPFWANWAMFRPRNVELNLGFSEKKLLGAQPDSNYRTPQLVDHQLLYWITTILRIYTPFSDTAIFLHMTETKYYEICGWTVGFLNVKRGSRNWHLYPYLTHTMGQSCWKFSSSYLQNIPVGGD